MGNDKKDRAAKDFSIVKERTNDPDIVNILELPTKWINRSRTHFWYPPLNEKKKFARHLETCAEKEITWDLYPIEKIYKMGISKCVDLIFTHPFIIYQFTSTLSFI